MGVFTYRSIHPSVYPYGVNRVEDEGNPFLIATKEKALCDTLSKAGEVSSLKALESLLYEDLRIDKDDLSTLNLSDLELLAPLYRKKAVTLLLKHLKKETGNEQRYGFEAEVLKKEKSAETAIESAFIKCGTMVHLLKIGTINPPVSGIAKNAVLKIKL